MKRSNLTLSDISNFEAKLRLLKKRLYRNEIELKKFNSIIDSLNDKKNKLLKKNERLNKQIVQFKELLNYSKKMKEKWQLIGK